MFAHPLAHACLQDHRPTGYEVQLDTGQGGGHLWDSYRKIRRSHMPRKLVFQEPRYLPNDWYRREFLKLLSATHSMNFPFHVVPHVHACALEMVLE